MTADRRYQTCNALLPKQHRFLQPFTIECIEGNGKTTTRAEVEERLELFTTEPNPENECSVIFIKLKSALIAVTVSDNPLEEILVSAARQIVHPRAGENLRSAQINPVYLG